MPGMTETGAAFPSPERAPSPTDGVFVAVGIEGAMGAFGAEGALGAEGAEGAAGGARRAGAGGAGAGAGLGFGGTSWRYYKSAQNISLVIRERVGAFQTYV
jgi:hypothetical protein